MNMILTALNAVALVTLVAFHLQSTGSEDTQASIHVPQGLSQPAQLAIMTDRSANPAMLTNEAHPMPQATGSATQRWVF